MTKLKASDVAGANFNLNIASNDQIVFIEYDTPTFTLTLSGQDPSNGYRMVHIFVWNTDAIVDKTIAINGNASKFIQYVDVVGNNPSLPIDAGTSIDVNLLTYSGLPIWKGVISNPQTQAVVPVDYESTFRVTQTSENGSIINGVFNSGNNRLWLDSTAGFITTPSPNGLGVWCIYDLVAGNAIPVTASIRFIEFGFTPYETFTGAARGSKVYLNQNATPVNPTDMASWLARADGLVSRDAYFLSATANVQALKRFNETGDNPISELINSVNVPLNSILAVFKEPLLAGDLSFHKFTGANSAQAPIIKIGYTI
jgi:hypothetical protein